MPKPTAVYPDWVMKYKEKGTYINKVGDKYYLYKAHSERIKGTNKIKRVCDGYLGRITETDGLIPPKDKLLGSTLSSFELGWSFVVLHSTVKIHAGLRKTFVKHGDLVYVCSVLNYVFGAYSFDLFRASSLCFLFPDIDFPTSFTESQINGICRGTRMITDTMNKVFSDDLKLCKALFSTVSLIRVNTSFYLPAFSEPVTALSEKYSIDWRNPLWQK